MAGWLPLSTLRMWQVVAGPRRAAGVCGLQLPNLGDSRNDLPRHSYAIAAVVPRHMVGDDPEERCERVGIAASAGAEKL